MTNDHSRLDRETTADYEPTVSLAHIFNVLRAQIGLILTALIAVGIAYVIVAILFFVTSTSQRTTSQPFQLIFAGAANGHYPNGLTFSPVEIVSSPILIKVYNRNSLGRFLTLNDFSRSMFVLESNPAYDALAREYEARLSDSKLSTLDRERIQKEFDLKREAITKNEFSINFVRNGAAARVPESMVRAVLVDTLNVWADDAVNQQHALDYRVAVLSPNVIDRGVGGGDTVAEILMLRSQISKVVDNIKELNTLPGAELVKTPGDRLSLAEISLRLDEILRFKLEPLMTFVATRHLVTNPASAQRFVQDQLAYDQRRLESIQANANAYRDALALYAQRTNDTGVSSAASSTASKGNPETVSPLINESFIDRLVELTSRSSDIEYRRNLANEYRKAAQAAIPYATAIAYDKQVLDQLQLGGGAVSPQDSAYYQSTTAAIRDEVRHLIGRINDIYQIESGNLRPSSQLFSMTAPPVTRNERSRSLTSIGLVGIVVMLSALVVVILFVLIRASMRDEEDADAAANA